MFWRIDYVSSPAADEVQWEKGWVSGAVYWGDETLTQLLVKVCLFIPSPVLHKIGVPVLKKKTLFLRSP